MNRVKAVVHEVLTSVAEEESLVLAEIHGDDRLVEDLGLRSLTFARVLAILEGRLGVDPFSKIVAVTSVRTVDDLCDAYRQCLEGTDPCCAYQADPARVEESRGRAVSRLEAARRRKRTTEPGSHQVDTRRTRSIE
jgi:hypothetical protein